MNMNMNFYEFYSKKFMHDLLLSLIMNIIITFLGYIKVKFKQTKIFKNLFLN